MSATTLAQQLPHERDLVQLLSHERTPPEGKAEGSLLEYVHQTGCRNWARIQIGEALLTQTPKDCADKCLRQAGCENFNFQFGGVEHGCHRAREAESASKSWCYLFRDGCLHARDKCNDLYAKHDYVAEFRRAAKHSGCANLEKIQKGNTTTGDSVQECALRCRRVRGCLGFNIQPHSCPGREQVARGACTLLTGICVPEPNACWDLYEMDGKSILKEPEAALEEKVVMTLVTIPGLELQAVMSTKGVGRIVLDEVRKSMEAHLCAASAAFADITLQMYAGSVIVNCAVRTRRPEDVANALTSVDGLSSEICLVLAATPEVQAIASGEVSGCSMSKPVMALPQGLALQFGGQSVAQSTLVSTPTALPGDAQVGVVVSSVVEYSSAAGVITKGDAGVVVGPGKKPGHVKVDFPSAPGMDLLPQDFVAGEAPPTMPPTTPPTATPTQTPTSAPSPAPPPTEAPTTIQPPTTTSSKAASSSFDFTLPNGTLGSVNDTVRSQVLSDVATLLSNLTTGSVHVNESHAAASGQRLLYQGSDVIMATFSGDSALESFVKSHYDEIQHKIWHQVQDTLAVCGVDLHKHHTSVSAASHTDVHDVYTPSLADRAQGTDTGETSLWVAVTILGAVVMCGSAGTYLFLNRKRDYSRVAALQRAAHVEDSGLRALRAGILQPPAQSSAVMEHSCVQSPQPSLYVPPGLPKLARTHATRAGKPGCIDLDVLSSSGFVRGDRVLVASSADRTETKIIKAVPNATSVSFYTGLYYSHPDGACVAKIQAHTSAHTTPLRVDSGPGSPQSGPGTPGSGACTPQEPNQQAQTALGQVQDAPNAPPSQGHARWTVDLTSGHPRQLGLQVVRIDDAEEMGVLLVGSVLDNSRASDWNAQHGSDAQRHERIHRLDLIETVNGIGGTIDDRLHQLQSGSGCRLELRRADHRLRITRASTVESCDQCCKTTQPGSLVRCCEDCDWLVCGDCCSVFAGQTEEPPAGRIEKMLVHVDGLSNTQQALMRTKWCEVSVGGMRTADGEVGRTRKCRDCLDPEWKQTFEFAGGGEVRGVDFAVFCDDGGSDCDEVRGRGRLLGRARLLEANLHPHGDAGEQQLPLLGLTGEPEGAFLRVRVQLIYRWD